MCTVVETCHPPCGVEKSTKYTGVFPMNTHTPHCTYNATPNTTATPATPTTSVSIPIDVYHKDILDEIETIKVTLHDLAGAVSALYRGKLKALQVTPYIVPPTYIILPNAYWKKPANTYPTNHRR